MHAETDGISLRGMEVAVEAAEALGLAVEVGEALTTTWAVTEGEIVPLGVIATRVAEVSAATAEPLEIAEIAEIEASIRTDEATVIGEVEAAKEATNETTEEVENSTMVGTEIAPQDVKAARAGGARKRLLILTC